MPCCIVSTLSEDPPVGKRIQCVEVACGRSVRRVPGGTVTRGRDACASRVRSNVGEGAPTLSGNLGYSANGAIVGLVVSVFAGATFGVLLMVLARMASKLVTPSDPMLGMMKALALNGAGMIAAVAALAGVFFVSRESLVPFGGGLIAGFMLAAAVMMVSLSVPHKA